LAIFHLTVENGSRSGGQSAVAKMEYNLRLGRRASRTDLVASGSENLPSGVTAAEFWAACDEHSRANGRLFTHVEAALPNELSRQQQLGLVRAFLARIGVVDGGRVPMTWALHDKGDGNPHIHIQLSSRVDDGATRDIAMWFRRVNNRSPERGGARSWAEKTDEEWIEGVREMWAELQNDALRNATSPQRVDHRSHFRQGIERAPTRHVGWARGRRRTAVVNFNREVRRANSELNEALTELRALRAQDFVEKRRAALEAKHAKVAAGKARHHRAQALLEEARLHARLKRQEQELLDSQNRSTLSKLPGTRAMKDPRPDPGPKFTAKKGSLYGVVLYVKQPEDTLAFVDTGMRIKLKQSKDSESLFAALELAASRWHQIVVTCSEECRGAWWREALALGIEDRVHFKIGGDVPHPSKQKMRPPNGIA
jgi:hypothetical protein